MGEGKGKEREGKILQESEIAHPGSCVSCVVSLPNEIPWLYSGKNLRASQRKVKVRFFREIHSIGRMPTILESESHTRTWDSWFLCTE